jgi:hypothetical protein
MKKRKRKKLKKKKTEQENNRTLPKQWTEDMDVIEGGTCNT